MTVTRGVNSSGPITGIRCKGCRRAVRGMTTTGVGFAGTASEFITGATDVASVGALPNVSRRAAASSVHAVGGSTGVDGVSPGNEFVSDSMTFATAIVTPSPVSLPARGSVAVGDETGIATADDDGVTLVSGGTSATDDLLDAASTTRSVALDTVRAVGFRSACLALAGRSTRLLDHRLPGDRTASRVDADGSASTSPAAAVPLEESAVLARCLPLGLRRAQCGRSPGRRIGRGLGRRAGGVRRLTGLRTRPGCRRLRRRNALTGEDRDPDAQCYGQSADSPDIRPRTHAYLHTVATIDAGATWPNRRISVETGVPLRTRSVSPSPPSGRAAGGRSRQRLRSDTRWR